MAASGSNSAAADNVKTPAQLMQEQHEAAASHQVTIEDVADADDGPIPQPSSPTAEVIGPAPTTNGTTNGAMSAKAAGKQKATNGPSSIDVHSEEKFPSLGSGPKPRVPPAPSWGKKPLFTAPANGETKDSSRPPSSASNSSRTTAVLTPPVKPQDFGQVPSRTALPGQISKYMDVPNAYIDGSKSIKNVLAGVNRKFGVKVETQSLVADAPATRFIARGMREKSVEDALKVISEELELEQTKQITVPATVKSHIIGRSGQNVANLQKVHGVKIQLRDRKPTTGVTSSEMSSAVVEIKGRPRGVDATERAIKEMIKDKQPRLDLQLQDVLPQYFPFLSSQHAAQIQQWENQDVKVQIPEYGVEAVQAQSFPTITVSGDHEMAPRAFAELEQLAKSLQDQLKTREQWVGRSMHPFIIGARGLSQREFMETTGCIVILPEDDADEVVILGPEDRLGVGAEKAVELATSVSSHSVDLKQYWNKGHLEVDEYARALAQYFQQKQLEEEFRKRHEADIVFPAYVDSSSTWNVFAKDSKMAFNARADLGTILQAYPPQRLDTLNVSPFYHSHLDDLCRRDLKNEYQIHMTIPEQGATIVLVHEEESEPGTSSDIPRQRPSAAQLKRFADGFERAKQFISTKIGDPSKIVTTSVPAPKKYHDKIRKAVATVPQPTPPEGFPVQIHYGATRSPLERSAGPQASSEDEVHLSSQDSDRINQIRQFIMDKLVEIGEDEKTRSYTTSVSFSDKFKSLLIGKQGANINALREKHDVEIDTKEADKVTIKGPQKYADACKEEISRLGKQWADEVTYKLKIEPKFFGSLIGKNGENMNTLRGRVDNSVTIQLPPKSRSDDSQSVAETASDAGSLRNSRANQAADEIVIRGPRQKADLVKAEIDGLYKWIKENSHEASVSVAKDQIRLLLGKGGQEMEKLRIATGAKINVPKSDEASSPSGRVTIRLQGSKDAVDKAKAELQKKSTAYDAIVTRKINIDRKYHRNLIGSGGSNIKRIVMEAGGPENSAEAVQFSKQGSSTDEVTVSGTVEVVGKIVAALEALAAEKENETTESIDVPEDQHSKIIGQGGQTRQALESKHNIRLEIPRKGAGTAVKITGSAPNVAAAKAEILERTAKPAGEKIDVPKALHHSIGNNGQLFRELRGKKVVVDHGGQKPPPKSSNAAADPRAGMANGSMPLITDETDSTPFQWKIVDAEAVTNGDSGTIPWILSGPAEEVNKAKARIEQLIANSAEPKSTGYLILSDPALHRHIIGRNGSKINEIRRQANCDIQVPRGNGTGQDAITIVGDREGCEQAKALILEAVQRGEGGNGGPRGSASPRV